MTGKGSWFVDNKDESNDSLKVPQIIQLHFLSRFSKMKWMHVQQKKIYLFSIYSFVYLPWGYCLIMLNA